MKNKKGQSLLEYLILIALMGVATIGVIKALNHAINAQFADIIYTLKGSSKRAKKKQFNKRSYEEKDFSNFLNGSNLKKQK